MSSRLVTTPWFTKNLAGGWTGMRTTSGALGGTRGWGGRGDGSAGPGRRGSRFGAEIRRAYDPAMLLAVDVGNSNVTIGSFRNGSLVAVRRASTPRAGTADELELLVEG